MKRLMNGYKNLKIRTKLFLAYVIVAVIPLVFVTAITFYRTRDTLEDQSYRNMVTNLRQANNSIYQNLQSYYNILDIIIVNRYVQDYISIDYSDIGYEEMYYFLDNFFKGIVLTNDYISNILIYSENKTLPFDDYYFHPADETILNKSWYARDWSNVSKPAYGEFDVEKDGRGYFTIVRSMNRYNRAVPRASLVLKIKEEQLKIHIEKLESGGTYLVTDGQGVILSSSGGDYRKKTVGEILGDVTLGAEERQMTKLEGEPVIMASLGMENGWYSIALMPLDKFSGEARKSSMVVLVIFLVFAAFSLTITLAMAHGFSRKTGLLMWGVNEMKNGYFEVCLPDMGNDEFGELADAFNNMSSTINELIYEVYQKELMQKQSELNLLQEQVNPHFLYNALASISALALKNSDEDTYEMVRLLSDFYRISLNSGKSIVTIRKELDLTRCYIAIQKVRFRDKIEVTFDVDERLLECTTLKLILQPVIENSINHGRYDENIPLVVSVVIREAEGVIRFIIQDNGKGFDEDVLKTLEEEMSVRAEGFGLKNINVRVKLRYGEAYGVAIHSRVMEGVETIISIPKEM